MPKNIQSKIKNSATPSSAAASLLMGTAGLPAGFDPQNAKGANPWGAYGTPGSLGIPTVPGGAASPEELVRRSNFWRDNYNPLRGLTIARLMALFEQAERGAFSEIQLTLRKAEKRYPVLKGFIERMLSSVEELDWDVKPLKVLPDGVTPAQVEAQRKFLRSRYDLLTNFNDAIGQITLAEVRGYSVLQKHRYQDGDNAGAVRELCWLEPWCFVRDGFYGDFYYNENSQFGVGLGSCQATLGEENRIGSTTLPREDFVIREVNAPLYEIALIAFVNWLMGRKDYAAFVEIFGLARGVVIMPPNIPPDKATAFEASAREVSDGSSGALPNGADIKFPTAGIRGEHPFESFCGAQDKDFVMAATSGILSMLESSAGGLNKGPNQEHGDAWEKIAAMKGKRVNEVLRRDFDALELAAEFPGQPICVQFTLAVQDDEDVNLVASTVVALEGVGLQTDADEISERTGFKLTRKNAPVLGAPSTDSARMEVDENENEDDDEDDSDDKITNRVTKIENRKSVDDFAAAVSGDLQHLRDRVAAIEAISDPDLRDKKYRALLDNWDQIVADITADPESARVLEEINADALITGLQSGPVKNRKVLNGGPGSGNFGHAGRPGQAGGSYPRAPKRMSVVEADALLTKGHTVSDQENRPVKFGQRLKDHFEHDHTPAESIRRKEHLPHGMETVRSGTRVEIKNPKTGETRAYYGKYFSDQGAEKGFLSIVDTKDGEAFTAFRAPRKYIASKGIKNRGEKDGPGEQPPAAVLQAIAAAGGLPDWFQRNPNPKTVKL